MGLRRRGRIFREGGLGLCLNSFVLEFGMIGFLMQAMKSMRITLVLQRENFVHAVTMSKFKYPFSTEAPNLTNQTLKTTHSTTSSFPPSLPFPSPSHQPQPHSSSSHSPSSSPPAP